MFMKKIKGSSLLLSRLRDRWWILVLQIFIVILCLLIIVPFFWMVTSSLKTTEEYLQTPIVWFPSVPQWQNYAEIMVELGFWKYIINSLLLAFMSVVLSVFSSAFVAYGFCRFRFRGRKLMFAIMVVTMMLPGQVTIVPQFLLFKEIGWTKTFLPLVIPQLCGAAGSILLITQFMKGVPMSMDEAAKIDGANSFQVFFKVILPQIVPVLVVTALFTFLNSWKDTFGPLIYLRNENLYTVPLALMTFVSPQDPNRAILFTGLTVALIPTIIVYIFGQKQLEEGIVIADLK